MENRERVREKDHIYIIRFEDGSMESCLSPMENVIEQAEQGKKKKGMDYVIIP